MHDLAPLALFRQFRTLKFASTVKSYQQRIQQNVWLNTRLQELTLEAAVAPLINNVKHLDWVEMKGDWKPKGPGHSDIATREL